MPSPRLAENVAVHGYNRPHDIALHFNDEAVTYGQLGDLVQTLRDQLLRLRLPAGGTVCVPAHKTPHTIALLLAIFHEGLIALAPSPDLGSGALERLSWQARVSHVLSATAEGGLVAEPVVLNEQEAAGLDTPDPARTRLLLTTSGSTGTPKIVPITTDGFDAFSAWATDEFGLSPGETALSYAPLNFDLALLDIWTFLRLGACVVLVNQHRATDAAHLGALMTAHRVTFVQGVPMLYRLLTEEAGPFTAARHVIFTGDSLQADLFGPVAETFPGARFHNVFGCTETNDSFIHRVDLAAAGRRIPIGRPVRGAEALVLDHEGQRLDGAGSGELLVSTPFQTDGYLQRKLNDRSFTVMDERVYYRTGDIVTRGADGLYHIEGRADWHVKVRGVRTNLQEVESVIASHPDVAEAVVVPLPDARAGVRLHARVTRRAGTALTGLRLRTHSGSHLPRHAIPTSVQITDTPLPRTSTGKPDRNLIKQDRMKETNT